MRKKAGGSAPPTTSLPTTPRRPNCLLTWPTSKEYITIPNSLDLVRSTDADLIAVMSREFHDSTRKQAASAVASTWVESFKQILDEATDAAHLLAFMSCIIN